MRGGFKEQLLSAVSTFTQATVQSAKVASKFVQQEALGAQCLLDYSLGPQVASAGSGQALWRVYTARSKKEGSPHPVVSAWILSKQELAQSGEGGGHGGGGGGLTRPSQRRLDVLLEQCRHDVQALARLKHPCVLRLIAPLEESRTQLVFITEPLANSLADLLGGGGPAALPPALAQERRSLHLSELEIKHGLLQVADGLHFLHAEAGLVHRGICPAAVVITAAGAWKLAGFGFSAPLEYRTDGGRGFDYSDPHPQLLQSLTQPPLAYVAPELVARGAQPPATGAADVFSLAALAFELLARRQLLPVGARLAEYESRVASLTLVDMTGVPPALEPTLRSMAAPVAGARPPAAAFAGCQYFQSDVLLRALKFLDTMLQREAAQKAAFLQDLPSLCAQFDSRVLRYLVLPPLLQELRDVSLQPVLLPIVLRIVRQQDPAEFADASLPALRPLLASAAGETLLLLVQHAELLQGCMPPAVAAQVIPALLVRAAEHGDSRAQEEMLKRVAGMADSLDYQGLKAAVLPAVHALCLATTSASVRVSAFAAMSRLAQRMDGGEAEAMLATAAKVSAVDKSAPTVMCVLALGAALARQHGPRLAAERVLPALAPLLVAPTLSSHQFATAVKTVRDVLAAVERGRGDAAGSPQAATAASPTSNGLTGGQGAAPPPPADWLAATAVGPSSGLGSSSRPSAAASTADPLAGLQLQSAVAAPRLPAPPASSGAFGLAGSRVGSAKPIGSVAAPGQQQQSWAAFGGGSNIGGGAAGMRPTAQSPLGSSSFGGLAASSSGGGSAALADPFAGLQLGGGGSSGAQGSSLQRPAPAAAPNGGAAAVFDPFSLGSSTTSGGATPLGGSSLQWPQPQQPQQPPQPSAGTAWPAGGSLI